MSDMRRREFITLLCGVAAAWPLAARAQQAEQVRKIGLVAGGDTVVFTGAFREQLQKLGWTEGYNLRIDRRTSAAELLALDPDILLAESTPLVQELKRHTRTIPIVFIGLGDPVVTGVVASLAHPGANATGFMNPEPSISAKWLELLKEIAPATSRVMVMLNADNVANLSRLRVIETSAPLFGVTSWAPLNGRWEREGSIPGPFHVHAPRLLAHMSSRPRMPAGFIQPCLPTKAPRPPSGEAWLHEIKHDGFRVIAARTTAG